MYASRRLRLWAGFGIAVLVGTTVVRSGPPSWPLICAVAFPMCVFIAHNLGARVLLLAGFVALAGTSWLADSRPGPLETLFLCMIFGAGLWLALRARGAVATLESLVSGITLPVPSGAATELETHLTRELARARRHERSLTLLSVAIPPGADPDGLPTDIAVRRRSHTITTTLRSELYRYASVVEASEVVYAIVPESGRDDVPGLERRLEAALALAVGQPIRIGVAVFPDDALAGPILIEMADAMHRRRPSKPLIDGGTVQ